MVYGDEKAQDIVAQARDLGALNGDGFPDGFGNGASVPTTNNAPKPARALGLDF